MPRLQAEAEGLILTAARVIAPLLHEGAWARGFDWCREQLAAAGYGALASEAQLARAGEHLARREYGAAVGLLREFERGDSKQRARAAVALSSLHLLEGQLEAAAGYADYCCDADPGSTPALVCRGNVHLAAGQPEAALQVIAALCWGHMRTTFIAQQPLTRPRPCLPLQLYEDALQVDAACPQAQYNAGLACRQLGLPHRALALMHQLLHAAPGHAEAMWHVRCACWGTQAPVCRGATWGSPDVACPLAVPPLCLRRQAGDLCEELGDTACALQWFTRLLTQAPHDSGALSRLGALHAKCAAVGVGNPLLPRPPAARPVPPCNPSASPPRPPLCRLGDEAEALACHTEAFAADRTNLETISWLGAHSVRRQDYAAAIPYFEAAAAAEPREVRCCLGGRMRPEKCFCLKPGRRPWPCTRRPLRPGARRASGR